MFQSRGKFPGFTDGRNPWRIYDRDRRFSRPMSRFLNDLHYGNGRIFRVEHLIREALP